MNAINIPRALVDRLLASCHVAVLTGAGISAESGVPTFREAQRGLWQKYDPLELATPAAFQEHPRIVWEWYTWRRQLLAQARPNPGHHALVGMSHLLHSLSLITQNVDGLHQAAGSDSVLELHGNIRRSRCARHGHPQTSWDESQSAPPRCSLCGSFLRPDVVWFGESLPFSTLRDAKRAAGRSDVFLSIGTSSLVYPAAALPIMAKENGALLVEVNTSPTPLTTHADLCLRGPSGIILPDLLLALRAAAGNL